VSVASVIPYKHDQPTYGNELEWIRKEAVVKWLMSFTDTCKECLKETMQSLRTDLRCFTRGYCRQFAETSGLFHSVIAVTQRKGLHHWIGGPRGDLNVVTKKGILSPTNFDRPAYSPSFQWLLSRVLCLCIQLLTFWTFAIILFLFKTTFRRMDSI
jgi:hypothetical protein